MLTRTEALAAAERADVYPKGNGSKWVVNHPTLGRCGCPTTVVMTMRGEPYKPDSFNPQAPRVYRHVSDAIFPESDDPWEAMTSTLDADPREVARRLREYAASLPEEVSS
jgi:hypothetical protein